MDEYILEIHAGSGGEDSRLFVRDMANGYIKYASQNNIQTEILDDEHNNVVIKLVGQNIQEIFGPEEGQHCVQRIPPTETNGRRQTSYVFVAVLPCLETVEDILESDLSITATKGKVKSGGQHSHKTSTAIRIVHKPTGISCFICTERSQLSNKMQALKVIKNKVRRHLEDQLPENKAARSSRGGKIRTYNFIKSRAVDHRTGAKTNQVEAVVGGRFDLLK